MVVKGQWRGQSVPLHPLNPANNINGIDGDYLDADGDGEETQELHPGNPMAERILQVHRAYLRRVIDTVNDLDNVLYEITNEGHAGSVEWQRHMIADMKAYQAGLPRQHPVGFTAGFFRDNSTVFDSDADWVSPLLPGYWPEPNVADGKKVVIVDTDHVQAGVVTDAVRRWIWKCLTRGLNPIYMDEDRHSAWGNADPIRNAMGRARQWAEHLDLEATRPRGELTSTGYALANPGREYLIYQPESDGFWVDLAAADYKFEWSSRFRTG